MVQTMHTFKHIVDFEMNFYTEWCKHYTHMWLTLTWTLTHVSGQLNDLNTLYFQRCLIWDKLWHNSVQLNNLNTSLSKTRLIWDKLRHISVIQHEKYHTTGYTTKPNNVVDIACFHNVVLLYKCCWSATAVLLSVFWNVRLSRCRIMWLMFQSS